ncbi:hypothetical protein T4E_9939 [Trichinella pseudospiralis]|uniref:Uncharacterized protein n=1 Tax=Trichinella pseudospiralis TaxID=6337 RepID=A0A0V0YHH7_TRIPS|nr:hypothetical protein T4E_9939 [Trichinella pseudospiralis]
MDGRFVTPLMRDENTSSTLISSACLVRLGRLPGRVARPTVTFVYTTEVVSSQAKVVQAGLFVQVLFATSKKYGKTPLNSTPLQSSQ